MRAPHLFDMSTEHRTADNPWGLEPLLDVGELAAYLGLPVSTVDDEGADPFAGNSRSRRT